MAQVRSDPESPRFVGRLRFFPDIDPVSGVEFSSLGSEKYSRMLGLSRG